MTQRKFLRGIFGLLVLGFGLILAGCEDAAKAVVARSACSEDAACSQARKCNNNNCVKNKGTGACSCGTY